MPAPDIHVDRHHVTAVVAGRAARAEGVLRSVHAPAWADLLADALSSSGLHGYWVVRRIRVSSRVAVGWTSGEVAACLARDLAQELGRRTRSRGDPDVLWFSDRVDFLAHYLLDHADDRTRDRWQYVHTVPRGRDSLLRLADQEPDTLFAALLSLRPAELERVTESLTSTEEAGLLEGLARAPGEPQPALLLPALRRLWRAGRLTATRGAALRLALTACRDDGVRLADVAGPATDVAALLAEHHLGHPGEALLGALARGRWHDAVAHTDPDVVLPFVRWTPEDRAALRQVLTGREQVPPDSESRHTPYGGIFLALQVLDDRWSWPGATRTWPDLADTPAVRLARLLTVAAAMGPEGRTGAVLDDAVARLALGIDGDLAVEALAAWAQALTGAHVSAFESVTGPLASTPGAPGNLSCLLGPGPGVGLLDRAATAVLAGLRRRLPGMAAASPAYLWRNVLDIPATVTLEADRALVVLGRAPLAVLLAMAGLDRGELDLEGEGGRRWRLTTGD